MEILGHSHIAVTMNTYTKVATALKRDAAKRIDDLINDLDRLNSRLHSIEDSPQAFWSPNNSPTATSQRCVACPEISSRPVAGRQELPPTSRLQTIPMT
jgi:hypothetical protein